MSEKESSPISVYMMALLIGLAKIRVSVSDAIHDLKQFKEIDETFLTLSKAIKTHKDELEAKEKDVREKAMEIFEEVDNPKIADGVRVNTFKGFAYDQDALTSWVKENLPAMMVVDWKAFNAYLKTAKSLPPGVMETSTPKVMIATDLSNWLPDGE